VFEELDEERDDGRTFWLRIVREIAKNRFLAYNFISNFQTVFRTVLAITLWRRQHRITTTTVIEHWFWLIPVSVEVLLSLCKEAVVFVILSVASERTHHIASPHRATPSLVIRDEPAPSWLVGGFLYRLEPHDYRGCFFGRRIFDFERILPTSLMFDGAITTSEPSSQLRPSFETGSIVYRPSTSPTDLCLDRFTRV
jgi:hypothetical protein